MLKIKRRHLEPALLVAVNPFAAAVAGVLRPRDPVSKNLVWVFTIFYGTVFYIAQTSGSDSVRYAATLRIMHDSGFGLGDLLAQMYAGGFGYVDIYQPLVTFIVSRITDSTWVLFGAFGVLLGYVYSRNIWFLIERIPGRISITLTVLLLAFAFGVGIGVSLNGIRMWTALHVFIFGVLHFADTRNKKYLLIALLTPLIHFSFVVPCVLLLGFIFATRYGAAIYVFFLASFLVSNLDIEIVRTLLGYLPQLFEERAVQGYVVRADALSDGSTPGEARPWFLRANAVFMTTFVLLASSLMYLRGVHREHRLLRFLLLFGMLVYGAINLVSHIPSAGRFYNIGELLIIAAATIFVANPAYSRKIDRQYMVMLLPLLAINIALGIRFTLEFASGYLLVGNFFLAPFVEGSEGLYEIVKSFL